MWELLKAAPKSADEASTSKEGERDANNSAENRNNSAEPSTSKENSPKDMDGTLMFQELLKDLPGKVAGQTAKNLSVPIAFVCLLHLANEKVCYNLFEVGCSTEFVWNFYF